MSLYDNAAAAEHRLFTSEAQIFDDTNPLFDYQGHWTVANQVEEFNSSSHIANASDAAAEIGPFRGSFIWVYGTIRAGQPAVQFILDHAVSNNTRYYGGSRPSYHGRLYASQLDPWSDHVLEMKTIDHGSFTLDFAVIGNFRQAMGQASEIGGGGVTNSTSSISSKSSRTIPVQQTISNSHITTLPPPFITAAVTPASLKEVATDVAPTVTASSSTGTTVTNLPSETSMPSTTTPVQPLASGSGNQVANMCRGSTIRIVGAFVGFVVLLILFTLSLYCFRFRRVRVERNQLNTRPGKLRRRFAPSLFPFHLPPRSPILPSHRRSLARTCQRRRNTLPVESLRVQTQYTVHDHLLSTVSPFPENEAPVMDISLRESSGISFATRVTYSSTLSSESDDEVDGDVRAWPGNIRTPRSESASVPRSGLGRAVKQTTRSRHHGSPRGDAADAVRVQPSRLYAGIADCDAMSLLGVEGRGKTPPPAYEG